MKTLVAWPPPTKSSSAEEEYINHLLEEYDVPLRLYEHLCWYIHAWGPSAVRRLVSSARSLRVRHIAAQALQHSLDVYEQA
ncbi:MAG: hypothetical protein WCA07_03130 [Gloeobacterales cyanobacterium]